MLQIEFDKGFVIGQCHLVRFLIRQWKHCDTRRCERTVLRVEVQNQTLAHMLRMGEYIAGMPVQKLPLRLSINLEEITARCPIAHILAQVILLTDQVDVDDLSPRDRGRDNDISIGKGLEVNPPDDLLILNIGFSPARTQSLLGISERYVLIGKVLCFNLARSFSIRKNQEGK